MSDVHLALQVRVIGPVPERRAITIGVVFIGNFELEIWIR